MLAAPSNPNPPTHGWPMSIDEVVSHGHVALVVPVPPAMAPMPTLPLIHNVGPILHDSSLEELPKDLKNWLDSAADSNEAVVYVSFGSMFIPEKETLQNLIRGLQLLVEKTKARVIWARAKSAFQKNGMSLPEVNPNKILFQDFTPQQAVLGYRSLVKAFVSHCGSGSTFESLHNRIPLLAIPLAIDQHLTANRLDESGIAIAMNADDINPDKLAENIQRLLTEKGFLDAVRQQQAILKLAGGGRRAAEIIETVAEAGNLKLLRAFDADWSWFAANSVDTFVVFYLICVAIIVIVSMVLLVLYRCCCKKQKTVKTKVE